METQMKQELNSQETVASGQVARIITQLSGYHLPCTDRMVKQFRHIDRMIDSLSRKRKHPNLIESEISVLHRVVDVVDLTLRLDSEFRKGEKLQISRRIKRCLDGLENILLPILGMELYEIRKALTGLEWIESKRHSPEKAIKLVTERVAQKLMVFDEEFTQVKRGIEFWD